MSQTESCNSRHFSWLMKSCFPNPNDTQSAIAPIPITTTTITTINNNNNSRYSTNNNTNISSLPDDLLSECLSRVPSSSLPSLSSVCRRWSLILQSPSFLSLRRLRHFLRPTVFTFSSSDDSSAASSSVLFAASLCFQHFNDPLGQWKVASFPLLDRRFQLSHARLSAIGPRIYIIGRDGMLCYDAWSSALSVRSSMVFPRKKFACAVVSSKIYVAGGAHAAAAVEEYDPGRDTWRVVAHAPRRRFGCIGSAVDGVFYVIGGLKIGGPEKQVSRAAMPGAEYASSMDLYDVEVGCWLRSRTVPGGGCVVAACAAGGYVYILASHAVELSFWRFDARRQQSRSCSSGGGGGGFGEWCRIESPPLPPQVRLDSTVRFGCVGVGDKVVLIQVNGCIDDLLRRSGRSGKGLRRGLVLVYDAGGGEWSRGPDLPEVIQRAACVSLEC